MSEDFTSFENLVDHAQDKLKIDLDVLRQITPEEIKYLLDHCPFLQMVNVEPQTDATGEVAIVAANTKWDIHVYDKNNAMSSSPGRFIFGGGYYAWNEEDEENGGGRAQLINPGQGTIVNQAFRTAVEMVDLAAKQGWKGIRLVDGHPLMMRAAWIRAGQIGMRLEGFTPDAYDENVRERLALSETEFELFRQGVRKRPSAS